MFAPNVSTHQLADAIHQERQADAALIRQAKLYRASHVPTGRHPQRRVTRRFAATLAGAVLTLAVAAAVTANQPAAAPAQQPANGGGLTLIR